MTTKEEETLMDKLAYLSPEYEDKEIARDLKLIEARTELARAIDFATRNAITREIDSIYHKINQLAVELKERAVEASISDVIDALATIMDGSEHYRDKILMTRNTAIEALILLN